MVTDFLGHLSSSPGSFESDTEYITSMLNSWVTTEELLHELVELIYTQVRSNAFSLYIRQNLSKHSIHTKCSTTVSLLNHWGSFSLQSTAIPNFSYTGARLCNYLSHHLTVNPPSGNFRQLLLQRWVISVISGSHQAEMRSLDGVVDLRSVCKVAGPAITMSVPLNERMLSPVDVE